MLDYGPCPPGKYITHPAECARAADELGMKHRDPLDGYHSQDIQRAIGRFSTVFRRGCFYIGTFYNGAFQNNALYHGAFFNRFGGLFYFYFFIGQVWWTFLFLFFHWPGGEDYR